MVACVCKFFSILLTAENSLYVGVLNRSSLCKKHNTGTMSNMDIGASDDGEFLT